MKFVTAIPGLVARRAPPPPTPAPATSTARPGRRRKMLEVPCCEKCDSHYLRIRSTTGNVYRLECRECGHAWLDTQREIIHAPRRPAGPAM